MMKRSLEILKFFLLLGAIVFLYSFGKRRNDTRKLAKIDIEFIDGNSPFITHNAVNKLLIQSEEGVTDIGKETLDLIGMESRLKGNPMVRNAQVFVTIDGTLGAKIEQRDPIARVLMNEGLSFYLDADGKQMPLSTVYSARVPIVTGISESDFDEITPLLLKIREDEFMHRSVVGLNRKRNGEIDLELRRTRLKVLFGRPIMTDKKFQNFKAFYKKTIQDSTFYRYDKVNLKFESQVIATKK